MGLQLASTSTNNAMIKELFNKLKNHPSRGLRISAGILLVICGLLGFLPVVGFWMIPLGVILLSVDFHWARRTRRKFDVWYGRRKQKKWCRLHEGTSDQD
jgi:uncharacterized membrane protein